MSQIPDLSNYILKNSRFESPKMLLSVTGGAKNFTIDEETKNAFTLGLVKAAKTTDSWIISGGTDVGVMRLVGDALEKNIHGQSLTAIGIAWYQRLAMREKLFDPTDQNLNNDSRVNGIIIY
jgi:hypothetical protein